MLYKRQASGYLTNATRRAASARPFTRTRAKYSPPASARGVSPMSSCAPGLSAPWNSVATRRPATSCSVQSTSAEAGSRSACLSAPRTGFGHIGPSCTPSACGPLETPSTAIACAA